MRFQIPARLLLLSALGLPVASYAASGDVLKSAVDAWSAHDKIQTAEETWQTQEDNYQAQPRLFPEDAAAEQTGRVDEVREERIGDFVSVKIDGMTVVFSDVPLSQWFAPYVRDIAERGIVSGYRDTSNNLTGKFGPQDNVTVEQMAKVMINASGRANDDCGTAPLLNATASGAWSAQFIRCTEKLQWSVYGDGSVDVHRNATRAEVMATLLQAFNVSIGESTGESFTDVAPTSLYGKAIEQAKRDSIISGYTDANGVPTGLFGPEDPVTRAEFAKIVVLGMQTYLK
jgi:hypothetical protein